VSCVLAGPDGGRARGIAFRAGGTALGPALLATGGAPVRLAGRLRLDRYKGREQPSFQIEDAAAGGA
jgi:single-stranded-DNA-specific exonuclease